MDRVERFFIGMAISGFVGLLVTVVGRLALAGYFEEQP